MDIQERLHDYATEYGPISLGITDPSNLVSQNLSWAKTAISCAFPYPKYSNLAKPAFTGSVASFAAGPDYHHILSDKLHKLADRISLDFPGHYCVHVDDIQIAERAIALRSGIGWVGRNQCMSIPGYGSYVVLGEILTDVEFSSSPIIQNPRCGSCTLCIKACPTKALRNDGSFCRELCISHLTQSRGTIPSELLSLMGDRVYGCDVCQYVCPYNQIDTQIINEMSISCYPGPHPSLSDILQISSATWKQSVRNTSVGWIGRNAWRRNAIVATANEGFLDAIPLLKHLCSDPSSIIAFTASQALAHMFALQ